jgi:phenylalanyl-tRNA synthetase alpha chain
MDTKQTYLQFETELNEVTNASGLETLRIKYLGRQGIMSNLFLELKNLPQDQKQLLGPAVNQLKKQVEEAISSKTFAPSTQQDSSNTKTIASQQKFGHLHPITQTELQLNNLFSRLGFSIYNGPIIETDEFNFQRLNVPLDHPARDMQDSIYIQEPKYLLRTQTSAIEARLLAGEKPPFKVAFPGTVYRNEKVNRSNHFVFHQYQAVVVDKGITMKDLIGTIDLMFKTLYGPDVVVRYRCKYYPEVEPGLGPDMQCFQCKGAGCPLCKGAGWIEMGGAGLIHPLVLKAAGIDPKVWRGFAFGMGLDRWAMANFKITDIRTLLGGNLAYKPYLK